MSCLAFYCADPVHFAVANRRRDSASEFKALGINDRAFAGCVHRDLHLGEAYDLAVLLCLKDDVIHVRLRNGDIETASFIAYVKFDRAGIFFRKYHRDLVVSVAGLRLFCLVAGSVILICISARGSAHAVVKRCYAPRPVVGIRYRAVVKRRRSQKSALEAVRFYSFITFIPIQLH